MDYVIHIIIVIVVFGVVAQSANLIMAYAGMMALCFAAFMAVGGYTSALLSINMGLNFLVCIVIGTIIAGVASAILVFISQRIRDVYLLVFTVAFHLVMTELATKLRFTGGAAGIPGIPRPHIFGVEISTPLEYLTIYLIICGLIQAGAWWLVYSPFGRTLKAIRENESAVQSLGKNVLKLKVLVFAIGGAMAAVSGSLLAHYITFVNPSSFTIHESIMITVMVVLGGSANFWGSILGTAIIVGLPEALRFVPGAADVIDAIRDILYGLLLVLFIFFRPVGLIPEYRKKANKIRPSIDTKLIFGPKNSRLPLHNNNSTKPILELNGVSKSFGGIQAAKDVSITLPPNKITALVGPNGCGKTTIFNLITGFLTPDAGAVYIEEKDVTRYSPHRMVKMGLVRSWQDTRIFPEMSVVDNVLVAFPNQTGESFPLSFLFPWRVLQEEKENYRRAISYLNLVGIGSKADQMAADISAAEQRLVSLARLLATGCPLLLLDEPTSGIDPDSVRRIGKLIQQIVKEGEKTVFLVEHNLDVIREIADNVYFMNEGQIIASGTPAELMVNPKLAEIYFGT